MDETLSMIRDVEELLAYTPDDNDLIQMLNDLQLSLKQQEQTDNNLSTSIYTPGSPCCIPFPCPWSNTTILLPARVIQSTDDSNTQHVLVLILTPLTQDTIPCPSFPHCHTQHCTYSHGYSIKIDWLLPIETMDIYNNKEHHYHPDSTVLYKSTTAPNEQIWKKATLLFSDIDSTGQHQWHISTEQGDTDSVGENQVIPLMYLDDEEDVDGGAIDNDATMTTNLDHDDTNQTTRNKTNQTFGGWQSHTSGFGEKMMKKMGYIQGEGLGTTRQGRLEPVEAYDKGVHYSQSKRPGLGSLEKKKKVKSKSKSKMDVAGMSSMFDTMNTILDSPPGQQKQNNGNTSTKPSKQTNQRKLWQLQDKMDRLKKAWQQGMMAVERNKGTSMEREFQANVDSITRQLQLVKQEIASVQGSLTRTKNCEKMTIF